MDFYVTHSEYKNIQHFVSKDMKHIEESFTNYAGEAVAALRMLFPIKVTVI